MQRLVEGFRRFRREEFGRHRELFEKLAHEGQSPHTLFISCCDSRFVATLITNSAPGELFMVKNIGAIVPPSHLQGPSSTAAAVEFAVEVLGVDDIVVCGHTQCGAMQAIVEGIPDDRELAHTREWLSVIDPVKKTLDERYAHITAKDARITLAAEESVLLSLENLHTFPSVMRRLGEGRLRLHGWCFKIATGEVFAYDPETKQFSPIVA